MFWYKSVFERFGVCVTFLGIPQQGQDAWILLYIREQTAAWRNMVKWPIPGHWEFNFPKDLEKVWEALTQRMKRREVSKCGRERTILFFFLGGSDLIRSGNICSEKEGRGKGKGVNVFLKRCGWDSVEILVVISISIYLGLVTVRKNVTVNQQRWDKASSPLWQCSNLLKLIQLRVILEDIV